MEHRPHGEYQVLGIPCVEVHCVVGHILGGDDDLLGAVERVKVLVVIVLLQPGPAGGCRPQLHRVRCHGEEEHPKAHDAAQDEANQTHQVPELGGKLPPLVEDPLDGVLKPCTQRARAATIPDDLVLRRLLDCGAVIQYWLLFIVIVNDDLTIRHWLTLRQGYAHAYQCGKEEHQGEEDACCGHPHAKHPQPVRVYRLWDGGGASRDAVGTRALYARVGVVAPVQGDVKRLNPGGQAAGVGRVVHKRVADQERREWVLGRVTHEPEPCWWVTLRGTAQQTYHLPALLGELHILARVVQVVGVTGRDVRHDLLHRRDGGIQRGRGEHGGVHEQGLGGVAGGGTEVPHEVLVAGGTPGEQLLGQLHLGLEGQDLVCSTAHRGSGVVGLVDVPGAVGLDEREEVIPLCRCHGGPVVVAVHGPSLVLWVGTTLPLPDAQVGTVVGHRVT